jgi:hypothetical protein
MGKIKIPIRTSKPGNKNKYLCLKSIEFSQKPPNCKRKNSDQPEELVTQIF